jgi:serine/threonine protein kinase/signal peptidase I
MDTKRICTVCGKPLTPGAPEGLCPECLLKAGLGTGMEIGADTGKVPRFVPPKIEELAVKFPQLEILEFIGQGGMGAVYKTRQKQLDRIVALKILPPQAASGAAFAERFTREARALARLNHPHIVTLYEFGQADGLFYFLMEFVDGVNLRQLLNASRMAPREALAIVPQICEALQFAHDTGIVHRDIKPENILLDKKGHVKIADFGVAKLVTQGMDESASEKTASSDDLTEAGSSLGTPQYMAPEQIKNSAEVDHRADIYSLGVVFYQMLTGELPSGKIEPPSKKVVIDVRLDEVVLRALEKKPELRYQQVSEVKTMVETIATTPQPPSPATPPGWKRYKDGRWNFELDIPVGLNPFAPVPSNSIYEVIRFMSHENGKHALILFRMPRDPKKSLKDISDAAQKVLANAGFGNFGSSETTIGQRPAQILDFDRPQDGGTWSCREYFLAEGTLGYVLGFGTTNKAALFETFECIAKSFQFQDSGYTGELKSSFPSPLESELLPFFPKTQTAAADEPKPESASQKAKGYTVRIEPINPGAEIPDRWFAFIRIPFVTSRNGKPTTNWPIVLATGALLEFLILFGLILGAGIGMPNLLDTRPIILMVLPIMALIPVWLRYEIRAGQTALAQGQPPVPLLSRRKKPLHRAVGCLLAILFVAFYLRTFVIAPYRVSTDSAAPEIPRGSQFLVWKLSRTFAPGDLVAYKNGNYVFIGRVTRVENDTLQVNKNGWPDTTILRSIVVGKVISIYWRGEAALQPSVNPVPVHAAENISPASSYVELPFKNPGMEDGTNAPYAWEKGWPVNGVEQIWDHTTAHDGRASLCLKKTANRYFPIAQWSQDIPVEPDDQPRKLRVRCWVKAQNVTKAIVDVNYQDGRDQHVWAIYIGQKSDADPLANFDWKLCEETVEVPANTSTVGIAFEIYGPGEVWFDDLNAAWEVPDYAAAPAGSLRTPQNSSGQTTTETPGLSFGQIITRAINNPEAGSNAFLNLATGKFVAPPLEISKLFASDDWTARYENALQAQAWIRANGVDVAIEQWPAGQWGLVLFDGFSTAQFSTSGAPENGSQDWKLTASQLATIVNDIKAEVGKTFVLPQPCDRTMHAAPSDLPKSFLFQTRDGSAGVLEIAALPDNPLGLAIRYKMVRGVSQASEPVGAGTPQSIRQRFNPTPGIADKTSWGVENHSQFNPDGWAVLANMTLGGAVRIVPGMLEGKTEAPANQSPANDVCRIKLVDGNDDQVTLDVDDRKWNKDITVKLNRDQWADLTVNGINYKIGYCSVWVAPDKSDTSPFANIVVTHSEGNNH